MLEALFSLEGIKEVNLEKFVNKFYRRLPKAVTASFISFTPKTNNTQSLDDYRHIYLIGSLYYILSILLASRLKKALPKLISNSQTTFLPMRLMVDVVLVINELVDFAKRHKKSCMLVKVDFEKACDYVSWNFLRAMMRRILVPNGWLGWKALFSVVSCRLWRMVVP